MHTKTLRKQMDDLLEGLLAEETAGTVVKPTPEAAAQPQPTTTAQPQPTTAAEQRERLAIIASGGQARQYLGKAMSVEEIDALGDDEVRKLYARMTKTLGKAALQFYTAVATIFLPIPPENRKPLMEDLESDPFVGHALTNTACELYYRYGKLLAPMTAALTTAKYCQFGHQCPRRIEEDGLERQQCDSTGGVALTGDSHAGGLGGGCRGAGFEGDCRDDAVTQPAV